MDNLTHTLTGLMLSRAGLDRLTPRAAAVLMLAANTPDLDTVTALGGVYTYLDQHRGFTHGLPVLPFLALLPTLAAGLWPRRPEGFSWLYAYLLACVGLASHLVMDWTNVYGIRLLSPLSGEWFRLDITTVIDIWIWLVLGFAVAWPVLARLVNSEIGSRQTAGAGVARFALAFLLLYNYGRFIAHARALDTLNSHLYDGGPPKQIAALPHFANPLAWSGLVELPGQWRSIPVNLLREFDSEAGQTWYQAEPSLALSVARRQAPFEVLQRFSRTLLWQSVQMPGEQSGTEVKAMDLRFGEPIEGSFTARAVVRDDGSVAESRFDFRGPLTVMRPH